MNLKHLINLQYELDKHINAKHPVNDTIERLQDKQLALLVELGELANEIRCFKYWSSDRDPRRDRVLEEGADFLHFMLSIAIDIGVEPEEYYDTLSKMNYTSQLLALYDSAAFVTNPNEWPWAMTLFLTLMESLGFTQDEVEQAYLKKNVENHRRQESGY